MATITTTFRAIDEISPVLSQIQTKIGGVISTVEVLDQKVNGVNGKGLSSVSQASSSASSALKGVGSSAADSASKIEKINSTAKSLKSTGQVFSGVGSALKSVGAVGLGVTGALGAMTAGAFKTALNFNQLYQSTSIVFERMLGGAENAKNLYGELYDMATKSPFPIETFLEASKTLVGVGVSADNTRKYMQAMTDAVAGFGGNTEKFNQLAFAFRRVATNGRISMMEVNMMADDGINALQILGNHYGKTTEDMKKMIAEEFVSSEEALSIICEGIEKGTDGINGATQAYEGMAQAMKSKTLTGAFDSMHTSIRQFALGVLDMDVRTESGAHRVAQLTAIIATFNKILEASSPIFKGITDGIGRILDALIGTTPVFNDQTGQWEQLDGVLTRVFDTIQKSDPDKLAKIGNRLVHIGAAAPILFGVGKAMDKLGKAMESLSRKKELLTKLFDVFSKKPKIPKLPKPKRITEPSKLLMPPVDMPDVDTPFGKLITKIRTYGAKMREAGKSASKALSEGLNSNKDGYSGLKQRIDDSFQNRKERLKEKKKKQKSKALTLTGNQNELSQTSLTKVPLSSDEILKKFDFGQSEGIISKFFGRLNSKVNQEGRTFGESMKKAITDNLPSGKGIGNKTKSIFSNLGQSSKEVGKAGIGIIQTIIPDETQEIVTNKMNNLKNVVKAHTISFGDIFSGFRDRIVGLFKGIGEWLSPITGLIQSLAKPVIEFFSPIAQAVGAVLGPLTGFSISLLSAVGAAAAATAGIGLLVGFIGKFGKAVGGVQFVSDIFKNIGQGIANFAANAVSGINAFFDDIKKNFPTYAKIGGGMIGQFVVGVVTAIPQLLTAGAQIIITLVSGIITSIPSLITAGFNAIRALVEVIVNNLPNIGAAFGQMFTTIGTTLQEHWPEIQAAGGQIITALKDGFVMLAPVLWDAAKSTFAFLMDIIKNKAPEWIQRGGELLQNFISGIITGLPGFLATAAQLVGSFLGYIWEHKGEILQAGGQIVLALINGVLSLAGLVLQTVGTIGYNIIMGIWNGAKSVWDSFWGWVGEKFNGLIDWVKGIFGISSPSTVFADIGNNLMEGLWQGFKNAWDRVSGWFNDILDKIKHPFQNDGDEEPDKVDYSQTIEQTSQQLELLKQRVNEVFTQISVSTQTLTAQISGTVLNAFRNMTSTVLAQLNVMSIQATATIARIPAQFVTIFNQLLTETATYIALIQAQMVVNTASLVESLRAPLNQITGIFTGIFNAVAAQTTALFTNFVVNAQANITMLISSISMSLAGLSAVFVGTFNGMITQSLAIMSQLPLQMDLVLADINARINAKFAELSILIFTHFTNIKLTSEGLMTQMSFNICTTINMMKDSINASLSQISTDFVAGWAATTAAALSVIVAFRVNTVGQMNLLRGEVLSILEQLKNSAWATFNAMAAGVMQIIQKLVEDIKNCVNQLPAHFRSIGEQMMDQLRAGIDAKKQSVINATHELVQKLKNTFLTGLGIHSPSKFMTYVGEMMAAGLMGGLSQSQIKQFAEGIIEDMRVSFKNGTFNPEELVEFLGNNTLDVVRYLQLIDDKTVAELAAEAGVPGIVQAAEKYVGYRSNGTSIFGAKYGNPGGAWCAYFVRACAEEAGVPFPATGYVPAVMSWAMANGRWTNTPVPGYAAIFGGGSHIELVAEVSGGNVTTIGGNTGSPRGVYKHVRNGATGYVALDGGHPVAQTLKDVILQAFFKKLGAQALMGGADFSGIDLSKVDFSGIDFSGIALTSGMLATDGSGLLNPSWFQRWTPSANVARWTPQVLQALAMLGEPASLLKGVLWAINGESSGDPNSTYLGDVNVVYGGSKGLLQTITPQFAIYRHPSLPNNMYDPLANIYACLNEMRGEYGSIAGLINRKISAGHWFGYSVGTRNVPYDMLALIHEGEAILPKAQNPYSESGGNYLKEIGDVIGTEVINTVINPELVPQNIQQYSVEYPVQESGLDYTALNNSMAMDTTSIAPASSEPTINVEVNIGNINTESDWQVAENRLVDMITRAIDKGRQASGGVASVYI